MDSLYPHGDGGLSSWLSVPVLLKKPSPGFMVLVSSQLRADGSRVGEYVDGETQILGWRDP